MLTFEQIKELIELTADRELEGLEIERSGFRLKIDGQRTVVQAMPEGEGTALPMVAAAAPAPAPAARAEAPAEEKAEGAAAHEDAHIVESPIVGTFYRAPAPDSDPFVEVGTRVSKGQVLCIVEAMKLMNEIESDADGVIVEIFPKNAQAVEFGEPLFALRPA